MNSIICIFKKYLFFVFLLLGLINNGYTQEETTEKTEVFKKMVLEKTEVDFLTSYYTQNGDNAAVSGGIGDEKVTDFTPTFIVSLPLNEDDVLTLDAGISAYSSASSSNINPFDGNHPANAFQASSGASSSDLWAGLTASYSHSSDDRNKIWTGKLSVSTEYDYFSFGFGGSYTRLFNEKNTEISINANIYLDSWDLIYPVELRHVDVVRAKDDDVFPFDINDYTITGNTNYDPQFTRFKNKNRDSYSIGASFSQILSKKLQGLLSIDVVRQEGLLSTPYQRVYFSDIADSFIENFHLADDVERLPDTRNKIALGGNLNYYVNEFLTVRTFYRFYTDNWGIDSHTAKIEVPIKIGHGFTIYPSYRYYTQTQADYFAPYEAHLSTEKYYTSDYDLSDFNANQYGIGLNYTDIFTKVHLWKFGLKSVDLEYNRYDRNTSFNSNIISAGFKFIQN
ncbi:MAG: hypothetical protein COZ75_01220 [Flavobacteriaceae bacterium CG_4_8_14_3_um_filter_34_10]|nr:DUF3570 domain-containing protein [Flavobacteriia bacterium]OIP49858.1 MAG: hypothetical protein AUK33_09350 [Flavobacteriaceae bacterium CG2_30_34_30]PIQ18836.1 MAG: hypothetical protein COW66_04225 [Flavobacteriaceae bacterium CG18_big_fil_WC_8_21_14_2_50_34_36]PIV50982.1 MAG: hypothetical protein COS19_02895 [Flavobacteriaceae bacterium CG02_land_8_20_14_3_00_34_13]PIX10509.1 MAG: hypothetical protein COZ75_01220 [Flavobacteriaceae bacterium CG_4_8_14_3_um_filter_34_10]PIZ07440.1 MAG: hy